MTLLCTTAGCTRKADLWIDDITWSNQPLFENRMITPKYATELFLKKSHRHNGKVAQLNPPLELGVITPSNPLLITPLLSRAGMWILL